MSDQNTDQFEHMSKDTQVVGTFVMMFTHLEAFVDLLLNTHFSGMEDQKATILSHVLIKEMGFAARLNLLVDLVRANENTEDARYFKDIKTKADPLIKFRNKLLHKARPGVGKSFETSFPILLKDTNSATQVKTVQQEKINLEGILDRTKEVADLIDDLRAYFERPLKDPGAS